MRARLLCLAVTLLVSSSLFAATVELRPSVIPSCEGCYSYFADFNGDGLDDVLTHDKLQFNLGGRFGTPVVVEGAFNPKIVGDLNHDGFADLVVTHDITGKGPDHLLLGNGAGGFTERDFPREGGRIIQAADFDGDGHRDLILQMTTRVSQHITLLRGRGDGTFTHHQTFPWPYSIDHAGAAHQVNEARAALAVGDLNNDGRPELVFHNDRYLHFLFAKADGTYGDPVTRFTLVSVRPVTIADLNDDGNNDIVFADGYHDPGVSVLYGDGTGRFPGYARVAIPHDRFTDRQPSSMAIGDFVPGGAKEIALSLNSHEILMLSAADGQLRELGRTSIEGMLHTVYALRFRSAAQPELIVSGTTRPHTRTPWVGASWVIETTPVAAQAPAAPARRRSMGGRAAVVVGSGTYELSVQSKRCGVTSLKTWTIEREGLFVNFAPMPNVTKVESAQVGNDFHVRLFLDEGGKERALDGEFKATATGLAGVLVEWGGGADAQCPGLVVHHVEARLIR